MRGRKPQPTAAKILKGNPGRRPLNLAEPKPKKRAPLCPRHLQADTEARNEWRRMAPKLVALGILTEIDGAAFALYCEAYSRWIRNKAKVLEKGEIVTTKAGNIIQNPYLAIANRAFKQLQSICAEFGMTPSARSRVVTDRANQDSTAPTGAAKYLQAI